MQFGRSVVSEQKQVFWKKWCRAVSGDRFELSSSNGVDLTSRKASVKSEFVLSNTTAGNTQIDLLVVGVQKLEEA